jgi:sterol desaturase/sphingolipid hydroxylase (fatty acid hydroxylase superfamily)
LNACRARASGIVVSTIGDVDSPFLTDAAMLAHLSSFAMNVVRLCVWLALLSLVLAPLERWLALRKVSLERRRLAADVGLYFLNSILPVTVLSLLFGAAAVALQALLPEALRSAIAALPFDVRVGLSFLVAETGFYWGHRLSHQIAWLWRFHAVHHAPEHLYFLINTRSHPVDMIVTRLFGMTPLYVLGLAGAGAAGSAVPAAVIVLGTAWGFFIHTNVRVRLGILEWIVATPFFHHWHHTSLAPLDRNFAATLPLLDRVFGTLHMPPAWPLAYGLADAAATPAPVKSNHAPAP